MEGMKIVVFVLPGDEKYLVILHANLHLAIVPIDLQVLGLNRHLHLFNMIHKLLADLFIRIC